MKLGELTPCEQVKRAIQLAQAAVNSCSEAKIPPLSAVVHQLGERRSDKASSEERDISPKDGDNVAAFF